MRRGRPGGGGGCDMEKNWLKGRFRRRSCHDLAASFSHESNISGYGPHTYLHVTRVPISTRATTKNSHSNIDCELTYRELTS